MNERPGSQGEGVQLKNFMTPKVPRGLEVPHNSFWKDRIYRWIMMDIVFDPSNLRTNELNPWISPNKHPKTYLEHQEKESTPSIFEYSF